MNLVSLAIFPSGRIEDYVSYDQQQAQLQYQIMTEAVAIEVELDLG